MKDEVDAAVKFITKLIKQNSKISDQNLQKFQHCLKLFLIQKFINHWHPQKPWQGQGYRCLRLNGTNGKEPTIEKAASECGLEYSDLKLPLELTVWVDPNEVCCRFGEHKGSYCTVASFQEGKSKTYIDQINLNQISNLHTDDDCSVTETRSENYEDLSSTKENICPNIHYNNNSVECVGLVTPTKGGGGQNVRNVDGSPSNDQHLKGFSHANYAVFQSFPRDNNNATSVHYKASAPIAFTSPGSPPLHPAYISNLGPDYPHHFSSHENLTFNRLSPVNLNKSNWNGGGMIQCNSYQRNPWYINRHMTRV